MLEALVYRSTGSWYDLTDQHGKTWKGRIKGVFKIDGITSTNPIAVGDSVIITPESEEAGTAIISDILPRHNYISRQSPSHRKQHHIIASNVDQSLLLATFKSPRTSSGFIDRFLVASEAYHVPSIIVFNKMDTWREKEKALFAEWQEMYQQLGYQVMGVSATTGEGIEPLQQLLHHKTTLLSGHSGVGKSTLLNRIFPHMKLRTGEVSEWSGKGLHTTTFAQMFDLPGGGKVIDTPGVKEFGLVDIPREELSHYFPEMRQRLNDCRFNNCLHVNEPGCAIIAAVANGAIAEERYVNYWQMLDSIPLHDWD